MLCEQQQAAAETPPAVLPLLPPINFTLLAAALQSPAERLAEAAACAAAAAENFRDEFASYSAGWSSAASARERAQTLLKEGKEK